MKGSTMRSKWMIAAAPLALLAGCSGGSDDAPPPADANETALPDVTDEAANVVEAPSPTPTPTASPTPEETPSPVPPDEQVQADADAVGMTARVSREDATGDTGGNEVGQPAEEKR
jgi:hypothetical protein